MKKNLLIIFIICLAIAFALVLWNSKSHNDIESEIPIVEKEESPEQILERLSVPEKENIPLTPEQKKALDTLSAPSQEPKADQDKGDEGDVLKSLQAK